MEMMHTRHISSLLLLAAATALPAAAQYDQDINVEGKYVPEYIQHDRIGIFPRPVRFEAAKSSLSYSLGGVNADFTPQALPLQATGWRTARRLSDTRGYVELGLGSYLQSTLSAGYLIIDNPLSALGVRLQHNSTSLWRPKLSASTHDSRMWRYDESLGVYGHHTFEGKGRLDAALDYHIGNFDYYGCYADLGEMDGAPAPRQLDMPTQTLNDVSARVAWHSTPAIDDLSWNVGARVRYFGYRSLYDTGNGLAGLPARSTGGRETHAAVDAGIDFPTSTSSAVGITLDADLLAYGDYEPRGVYGLDNAETPGTYGMVTLTPYYRLTRQRLSLRIGAQVDIAANARDGADRYRTFHIAPDVRLDYNAGPVSLFARATGGSELHTLAAGYELDYYQMPAIFDTKPVYTPVDAQAGVSFGPFSGFHAGFDVAWRMSRGQYFGGWYATCAADDGQRLNLHGWSAGINAGYDAGRIFKVTAEGRWQRQRGTTGYFNGYDRPEWTVDAAIESNPGRLGLRLEYKLRAMRMMNMPLAFADGEEAYRLPNLSMLGLGVSYRITDSFDVWAQADNLLCRRNYTLPGLPEPRLRLAAGLGFRF